MSFDSSCVYTAVFVKFVSDYVSSGMSSQLPKWLTEELGGMFVVCGACGSVRWKRNERVNIFNIFTLLNIAFCKHQRPKQKQDVLTFGEHLQQVS